MAKTLDNEIFLSIFYLKKAGVLKPGSTTELGWFRGDVLIQRTRIFIFQNYLDMVGGKIALEYTPCHFGGRRAWLLCPMCNRRSGTLFGSEFICRHCIGLHYGCQHEGALERSQRRLKKFKERVFGTASPWQQPKGQYNHTFLNNLGEYCDLVEKQNGLYMKMISSAKTRLNSA